MKTKISKSILLNTNLIKYISLRWFNSFAIQIITLSVGWQVYTATKDPLALGLIGLAQFAPIFFLILPAGVIADKYNRKNILIICNLLQIMVAGFFLYYTVFGFDKISILPIYLLLIIHGAARAFYEPNIFAILPNIVKPEMFPRSVTYVNFFNEFGSLIGPIVAGLLIAIIGGWVYLIALLSFLIATISAFLLPVINNRDTNIKRITLKIVLSGFVYVWKTKIILGTMTIDLLAVLFSTIMGMLPIFASDILEIGPEGLGLLRATPSMGGILAALLLTQLPQIKNAGKMLIYSTIVFGVATAIFAYSTILWLSLTMLIVYGAADMVSKNIRHIMIPTITPDNMRGRVMSVHSVTTEASEEVGDFRAGLMASFIETELAIFIGGVFTVGFSIIWWFLFPELKNVKYIKDIKKE